MPVAQQVSGFFALLWRQGGKLVGFVRLVIQQFFQHGGTRNAAALTFTSLLSLVPLMTVSLAIFYAFPVADKVQQDLQHFLFENFVPAAGAVLQDHLKAFSDKASRLNGPSFAFLILVALLLMSNIDRSLNAIWGVRSKRRLVSKFLIYWAVLTLGPVLIVASVLATSQLVVLAGLSEMVGGTWQDRLLKLAPVGASLLAFTLIYGVVPNVRVRLWHALAGGAVAALLFEAAKRGFAFYIKAFPTYEAIYGALAAVPIFLLWMYLSWTVVLIGAEVAHALRMFHWNKPEPRGEVLGLADAVYVLLLLDEVAAVGRTLSIWELTRLREQWREDQIQDLLADMADRHWVHQARDGTWSLTRRLADFSLYEVMTEGRFTLPPAVDGRWERLAGLSDCLDAARSGMQQALDVPLSRFRLQRAEPKAISPATQAG